MSVGRISCVFPPRHCDTSELGSTVSNYLLASSGFLDGLSNNQFTELSAGTFTGSTGYFTNETVTGTLRTASLTGNTGYFTNVEVKTGLTGTSGYLSYLTAGTMTGSTGYFTDVEVKTGLTGATGYFSNFEAGAWGYYPGLTSDTVSTRVVKQSDVILLNPVGSLTTTLTMPAAASMVKKGWSCLIINSAAADDSGNIILAAGDGSTISGYTPLKGKTISLLVCTTDYTTFTCYQIAAAV